MPRRKQKLIDPAKDRKFRDWLEDVQYEARQIIPTVSLATLGRWPYSQAYAGGMKPQQAAMAVIVNACQVADRERVDETTRECRIVLSGEERRGTK